MADLQFSDVKLVIGEPNQQIRRGMRGFLQHKGFRAIMEAESLESIAGALANGSVDMLIGVSDFPDGSLSALARRVRNHEIGPNPFVLIISVVEDASEAVIRDAINGGVDDLVLKPLSGDVLYQRILNLAQGRKPFVVTTDYVGPERRKVRDRPGKQTIPQIEVPNPVREIARGHADLAALQEAIDRTAGVINEQKMERHAFQIDYLVGKIVPLYKAQTIDDGLGAMLSRLHMVAEDITRRLRGTRFDHAGEMCRSMVELAARVREGWRAPEMRDVQLLPELAAAIRRAFEPGREGEAAARDMGKSAPIRSH